LFSEKPVYVCHPDRSAAILCPFKKMSGAEWRDPEDFDPTMPIQGVLPRLSHFWFIASRAWENTSYQHGRGCTLGVPPLRAQKLFASKVFAALRSG
jgi:hypothetical protein